MLKPSIIPRTWNALASGSLPGSSSAPTRPTIKEREQRIEQLREELNRELAHEAKSMANEEKRKKDKEEEECKKAAEEEQRYLDEKHRKALADRERQKGEEARAAARKDVKDTEKDSGKGKERNEKKFEWR